MPNGGYRMVASALKAYGIPADPHVAEAFTKYRKTHNEGVFDAYTAEVRRCRSSHILTGLPDAYGRGRIIGDYRRVALYGVTRLLEHKREALARTGVLDLVALDGETAPLGGLAGLKRWLARTRAGLGERARDLGLPPPRGVLLVGIQGCGKSLAAKAIARDWQLPLARLDPGRLFDKYVGESEKNLREAFAGAAAFHAASCRTSFSVTK